MMRAFPRMSLAPGTGLGAYEIITALGAGGMGEVYRARDTRLGREVALKILPITRGADPELRLRFEREAQALAALSNPHIAAIYDVIEVADHRTIVMELVPGPTLAQVIARGPVPVRTAIGYAIDISDALSVAHAAGIVHRDLKPANVVITEAGSAKVLDFGVAKLGTDDADVALAGTATALTRAGALIGTIGYMSPEQAHGRRLDARSDIFSFGLLLHEMIAGRSAFHGDSAAALLSAVLRDDPPPLRTLVPSTPRSVERCVTRCLEKDPRRRYQSAADLKAALEDIREDLDRLTPVASEAAGAAPRARRLRVWSAVSYATAALAIATLGFVAARTFVSATLVTPTFRPLVVEPVPVAVPVWSPDGRTLAYLAATGNRFRLFLRDVESSQSTLVTTQELDGTSLFWSPDGSRLYFTRVEEGDLMQVGAGGGEAQVVATAVDNADRGRLTRPGGGLKACISPDGRTIVLTRADKGGVRLWSKDAGSGTMRVLEVAGLPQPLATVQALAFSPDGASLAMIASTTALNDARGVWLISWPAAAARHLFDDARYLAANPSIAWMPDSRRFVTNGYPAHGGANRILMADVKAGTLTPLSDGKDDEFGPSVSPDGSRIAFMSRRSGLDLIQFPVDGGPPEPLLATSRSESNPDLLRSGLLAYVSDADGPPEVRIRAGGDAWPRTIGGARDAGADRATQPVEVRLSPDGQRAAVGASASEHLIWIYPTAGGARTRLDPATTDQHGASWSPDGNWVAFRRLRGGSWEIVKAPLGGGPAIRLDDAAPGGAQTDWSPDGRWIAHWRPGGMRLVSSDGGTRRVLHGLDPRVFRFARDGSRLFAVRRGAAGRWELTIWDVAAGRELRTVPLSLAASADIQGMTLSADESRIVLGAGTATSDIWLLEQFAPAASFWTRWFGTGR